MVKNGCCGDICTICPRYTATRNNDKARLRQIAGIFHMLGWRDREEPPEEMACYECDSVKNCRLGIKECVSQREIANCGECIEYPCDRLSAILENNLSEVAICKDKLSEEDGALFEKAFFSKKDRLDNINKKYRK